MALTAKKNVRRQTGDKTAAARHGGRRNKAAAASSSLHKKQLAAMLQKLQKLQRHVTTISNNLRIMNNSPHSGKPSAETFVSKNILFPKWIRHLEPDKQGTGRLVLGFHPKDIYPLGQGLLRLTLHLFLNPGPDPDSGTLKQINILEHPKAENDGPSDSSGSGQLVLRRRVEIPDKICNRMEWNLMPLVRESGSIPGAVCIEYPVSVPLNVEHLSEKDFFAPRLEAVAVLPADAASPQQKQLRKILAETDYKGVIIYPPTVDWNLPLFQRPHQLSLAFAEENYLVFFMTPNGKNDHYSVGFHQINDHLYVANVPMDTFSLLPRPIVMMTWTRSAPALAKLSDPFIFYDYIDELDIFYGHDSIQENIHQYLLVHADIMAATALTLLEKARKYREDTVHCPNGVDFAMFNASFPRPEAEAAPHDLQPIISPGSPVIGYYGALAEWLDYELLAGLAKNRKDVHIVLIGMDYDGSLGQSGILDYPNVAYLGTKYHSELYRYLAFFDVAVIPFKINKITTSTNPIKMYEHMAAGKPIVATNIPECSAEPQVLIASDMPHFLEQIDKALELKQDEGYRSALVNRARQNTWKERVRMLERVFIEKRIVDSGWSSGYKS